MWSSANRRFAMALAPLKCCFIVALALSRVVSGSDNACDVTISRIVLTAEGSGRVRDGIGRG